MKNIIYLCLILCCGSCFAEEPFKKIYVTYADLVTMPEGVYFVDSTGSKTPVNSVYHDWDGMFIMLVDKPVPPTPPEESYPAERYQYPNPTPNVHPRVWYNQE